MFKRKRTRKAPPAVVLEPPTPVAQLFAQDVRGADPDDHSGLPRFKATAADQMDRRRTDKFTATRLKLRNAFTPSQPIVKRQMFAGRSEVLGTMIRAIEDQRLHIILYGDRGIGKTSLLHALADSAREARYIVLYTSCGADSDFRETFRAAAAEIPLLFHSDFGPVTQEAEAGSSLLDVLPDQFSPREFADTCLKLKGTRVLVILDEFDRAVSATFRRELAELVKFLSDRTVRLQLVIGGVAADVEELIEHIPSIRRNVLALRVPHMLDEEVRAVVARGAKAADISFETLATEFVVRVARGWPYIATLICHHAGLNALDAGRDVVRQEDVSAALEASLSELRARMPRHMSHQVDRLLESGAGKPLTLLAGASLSGGADFALADLEKVGATAAEVTTAKRLVEQLASEELMMKVREAPTGRRYVFAEDSLPPYLWFTGLLQAYRAEQVKPQRASNA
jgi:Cdc6-like AAA superfamily ATPase